MRLCFHPIVTLAVFLRHFNDDALDLSVGLEAVFAQLATDTRHLKATERRLRFQDVVTVDPDHHHQKEKEERRDKDDLQVQTIK